jgi:hypothetical protein
MEHISKVTDEQAKRNFIKFKRDQKAKAKAAKLKASPKVDNQYSVANVVRRYGAFSIAARMASKGVLA